MLALGKNQIINITELQKISAKRLSQIDSSKKPLIVMDAKRKTGIFVLVDFETYEQMLQGDGLVTPRQSTDLLATTKKIGPAKLNKYDFASRGLFWDDATITNSRFRKILKDKKHPRYSWAVTRLLERLTSKEILALFSPNTIGEMLRDARPQNVIKQAWEEALEYWNKQT